MRCSECNKFVPLDVDQDPEVELDVGAETGEVTGTVRIVNACQECGNEMTETSFDVDLDFDEAESHMEANADDDAHELELVDPELERTSHSTGRSRGTRTFYGAEGDIVVKCSCGQQWTQHWSDEVQASHMDTL